MKSELNMIRSLICSICLLIAGLNQAKARYLVDTYDTIYIMDSSGAYVSNVTLEPFPYIQGVSVMFDLLNFDIVYYQ